MKINQNCWFAAYIYTLTISPQNQWNFIKMRQNRWFFDENQPKLLICSIYIYVNHNLQKEGKIDDFLMKINQNCSFAVYIYTLTTPPKKLLTFNENIEIYLIFYTFFENWNELIYHTQLISLIYGHNQPGNECGCAGGCDDRGVAPARKGVWLAVWFSNPKTMSSNSFIN